MGSSWTSFGTLKSVLVGNESKFKKAYADITFKQFYKEALNQEIYDQSKYELTYELSVQRNDELDKLAKTLSNQGIEVFRPDTMTKLIKFTTPEFESEMSPANNVRDITLVYGNNIIETPPFVRNRYFENKSLINVFNKLHLNRDYKWFRFPHNELIESKMDLTAWDIKRDYNNFNKEDYTPAIDGAQFLRIGKDVIVNINSYNHYLGYLWVKSFFPESNFHLINIADNHIDGALICLSPGKFLVNPKYKNIKDILPDKFKNWDYIFPVETTRKTSGQRLASDEGMDINILSINPNTVVSNQKAHNVNEALYKNGFNVIETSLNHCEMFGGGVHCSTLDLDREDEYIDYTK